MSQPDWRFEGSKAIKIRNGITFDFYMGLPHVFNKPLVHQCDATKHFTFTYGKEDGHEWL